MRRIAASLFPPRVGTYKLVTADVVEWAASYKGPHFYALLSDFPYDLGFMNKSWDKHAQFEAWGRALLPHLLPGALALVFGGTRTWHRLAVGMEDAGFELWDTVLWMYGQGFPKAGDIAKLGAGKDWVGYKTTALKPAWEPVLCFKKPLESTYDQTALEHGSGALNIDGSRIGTEVVEARDATERAGTGSISNPGTSAREAGPRGMAAWMGKGIRMIR